jgi:diamine N-acetyltransferase
MVPIVGPVMVPVILRARRLDAVVDAGHDPPMSDRDTPSFRIAVPPDQALLERLCRDFRLCDRQPLAPELVADSLRAALAGDPLVRVWIIELAGRPVGYLALSLGFSIEVGGRDALIDEIYLEESARGRGHGRRALEFAEEECRKLGVRRICLEVERHNPDARRLYERAGFRDHDRFLMSRLLEA